MKKWYRLIKEYPGSPKLGTLVSEIINEGINKGDYSTGDNVIDKRLIENQKGYWEELPRFLMLQVFNQGKLQKEIPAKAVKYFYKYTDSVQYIKVEVLSDDKNASNVYPYPAKALRVITKQEYLQKYKVIVTDTIPNNIINAWCQKVPHKVLEDVNKPYWNKTLENPQFGFKCVVRDLDIMDGEPVFIIGCKYAIPLKGFKEFMDNYKPKLTFGGDEVTVDGNNISCNGVDGSVEQLKAIHKYIITFRTKLFFGKTHLKYVYNGESEHYMLSDFDDLHPDTQITIGCTTGTWKELCDIIKHIDNA